MDKSDFLQELFRSVNFHIAKFSGNLKFPTKVKTPRDLYSIAADAESNEPETKFLLDNSLQDFIFKQTGQRVIIPHSN